MDDVVEMEIKKVPARIGALYACLGGGGTGLCNDVNQRGTKKKRKGSLNISAREPLQPLPIQIRSTMY
jgi:hypothetical protein